LGLNSPPAIHYVTDLRPEGNFPFAYEVTTDCLLTAAIEDRFGVTVCPLTAAVRRDAGAARPLYPCSQRFYDGRDAGDPGP